MALIRTFALLPTAGDFCDQGKFKDAQAHVGHTEPHAIDNAYYLGSVAELQASIWYKQDRVEEAKSEALRAADIFEKLGAARDLGSCRKLIQCIQNGSDILILSV